MVGSKGQITIGIANVSKLEGDFTGSDNAACVDIDTRRRRERYNDHTNVQQ